MSGKCRVEVPVGNVRLPSGELEWHGECRGCGAPLMEAIYTGGWMHKVLERHEFAAFVYSDGTLHPTLCVLCCEGPYAPVHLCEQCGHSLLAHLSADECERRGVDPGLRDGLGCAIWGEGRTVVRAL